MEHLKVLVPLLIVLASGYLMRSVWCSALRCLYTTMAGETSGLYSMAYVTVPSEEVAKKIAHGLVQTKLAACVNIIPRLTSVYMWEGKVNEDPEILLMLKTRTSLVSEVAKFVKENHPYDVPEVISSPIDQGHPPYLKWIGEVVADKATD